VFNTRGTVTSPGYPGNVSRTTDCRWELAVPIGMIIKIEFPGKKKIRLLISTFVFQITMLTWIVFGIISIPVRPG
jgi:hypothetical protein